MPHKYDPASLAEIMRRMKEAADRGRDQSPRKLSLQTRTLRYNRMHWATITGLVRHWEDSRLDVELLDEKSISVKTKNVASFALGPPIRAASFRVNIDGTDLRMQLQRGAQLSFTKEPAGWRAHPDSGASELRKIHGLQGPIDDAFLEPFLVVTPRAQSASPQVQKWVDFESRHFLDRWPALFRGEPRVKKDSEVTPGDIAQYHLVLWGDANSNSLTAKTLPRLPLRWGSQVAVGKQAFESATHVPLMVYPNPLNPTKYIVLNSGPTFREDDDRTNSLQNPKLPDWAIVDVTRPPDGHSPGKVVDADFFDERWQVR